MLGRTNEELVILKKTYFDIFNQDLADMTKAELGGDIRKVILTALQVRKTTMLHAYLTVAQLF